MKLSSIYIPSSVESIDGNPFTGSGLKHLTIDSVYLVGEDYPAPLERLKKECGFWKWRCRMVTYDYYYDSFWKNHFASIELDSVTFGESINRVGSYAFDMWYWNHPPGRSIPKISFKAVTSIGTHAFRLMKASEVGLYIEGKNSYSTVRAFLPDSNSLTKVILGGKGSVDKRAFNDLKTLTNFGGNSRPSNIHW